MGMIRLPCSLPGVRGGAIRPTEYPVQANARAATQVNPVRPR